MNDLYHLVRAIRDQYDTHFDQTWFRILLEACPLERGLLREIRAFIDSDRTELYSSEKVLYGVSGLEQFIRAVETYLLPNVKELLGVSGLRPEYRLRDRDQFVHRRLLAEVLPYNIRVLKGLLLELKAAAGAKTPPVMPELPVYRSA